MKKMLLLFCVFTMVNAQNKKQKSQFIEKNIESCHLPLNDSISIISIHENLYRNDIEIILKTENKITNECVNKEINY